ncbi:MAG: tetratricopeptide repeat protein [Ignavibacteriales bacterium]|nr:tetratricopeptide repeat protein [Ignavibacteriales bacterium]
MNFFDEIKNRKIRKYLAIYISACITTIGLVHLFSFRYQLPTFIFDTLLIFVSFGAISVIIIAWYHGKDGKQKLKLMEYFLHTLIFILATSFTYFVNQKGSVKLLPLNAKTIAVLPFVNMSDSKEDEYFSDGITDDVLTQLSKISELRVISRTSVMKYKETNYTIPEIANELGAGTILEGSVRRIDKKVRITAQLINSSNDEHIWAETFDRNINDIFEVQSEIAKHIASELEAQLAPKEKLLIETKPTNNIDAYAFCLKGRDFASKYTNEDNERAIEFYKKALAIDSNYAFAYACLASAYDQKVRRYMYSNNWRDSAIIMSNKALSLDPNLAEGHSSLAKSYEAKQNYRLAKYHYEKAIRLNPNYYAAIYNLGVVHFNEGSLDNAFKLINQSVLLEPDNVFGFIVMGGIYQKLNCDSLAIIWFKKALEFEPQNLLAHVYLVEQYLLMNNISSAEKYFENLENFSPDWNYTLSLGSKIQLFKQNYSKAKAYLDKAIKSSGNKKEYDYAYILKQMNKKSEAEVILQSEKNDYKNSIKETFNGNGSIEKSLADIFAIEDDNKSSINWLNKAVSKGWFEYKQNLISPYWSGLKNTKEFQNLVTKMQIKVDSLKQILINDESWSGCN